MTTETLGRFGHHPDHAIDFCVEVEAIEGELADIAAGLTPTMNLDERIVKAMTFRVGGDAPSIASKTALRAIEASRRAAPEAAEPVAWCALSIDGKHIAYFDGKPMVMPGRIGNDCHPVPLYAGLAPTERDAVEAAGWREVLKRAKDGLGAGGRNHGDQPFIDYGAALIDHIEEELDWLSTTTGRAAE